MTPNVKGWNDQNALNILTAPHLLIDANWPCDVPKTRLHLPDQKSQRRLSVQQDVEISQVVLNTVHKHAIDRHQLSPPSRLDWVCQMCSSHYSSHNSRSPLLILFPPLKLSKGMLSRGGNVTVAGQILTHTSCCDTATVANYIFTQWQKHNLGNIKMDRKILIFPTIKKKITLCQSQGQPPVKMTSCVLFVQFCVISTPLIDFVSIFFGVLLLMFFSWSLPLGIFR